MGADRPGSQHSWGQSSRVPVCVPACPRRTIRHALQGDGRPDKGRAADFHAHAHNTESCLQQLSRRDARRSERLHTFAKVSDIQVSVSRRRVPGKRGAWTHRCLYQCAARSSDTAPRSTRTNASRPHQRRRDSDIVLQTAEMCPGKASTLVFQVSSIFVGRLSVFGLASSLNTTACALWGLAVAMAAAHVGVMETKHRVNVVLVFSYRPPSFLHGAAAGGAAE